MAVGPNCVAPAVSAEGNDVGGGCRIYAGNGADAIEQLALECAASLGGDLQAREIQSRDEYTAGLKAGVVNQQVP